MRARVLFLVFLLSMNALAQTDGTFTWQNDEDEIAATGRSDDGYTNGTRFLWTWTPAERSRLDRIANRFCFGPEECERSVTAGIGQSMYTPNQLWRTDVIRRDRPYAGWLYATLMFDAASERKADHVELYLGVIGPDSQADTAQIFWHRHVTPWAVDPAGWDNQIGQWATVQVEYKRRLKLIERLDLNQRPYFDVTPTVGLSVGNVFDDVAAGAVMRVGYDLPPRFGDAIPAAMTSSSGETRDLDFYVFAGVEARYVARNIFIDAEDRLYRIKRKPVVRDHLFGGSIRYKRVRLEYTNTTRSAEFDPDPRSHPYGTIRLLIGANP